MKQLFRAVLVWVFCACLLVCASATVGDFNDDDVCDIQDVLIILGSVLDNDATSDMDVNEDGKVDLIDVIRVLRIAVLSGDIEEITEPTFVVEDITVSPGDTSVSVPVSIVKNPGILGMTLVVNYDSEAMTLVGSANGDATSMLTFTKPKKYKDGSIFTWYGEALESGDVVDGDVLVLTFDISETAETGIYPITVSYIEGDIFDADLVPLNILVRNGSCNVVASSSDGGDGGDTGDGDEGGDSGEGGEIEEITVPTFVVASAEVSAGATSVNVPVSVVKNPGILGMTLVVNYDESAMTLVGCENGDATEMLSFTKPKRYKSGSIFTWYGEALEDDEIADGEVLVLTFNISSDAADGEYPIEISYTDGDIFDTDLSYVSVAVKNGSIVIK